MSTRSTTRTVDWFVWGILFISLLALPATGAFGLIIIAALAAGYLVLRYRYVVPSNYYLVYRGRDGVIREKEGPAVLYLSPLTQIYLPLSMFVKFTDGIYLSAGKISYSFYHHERKEVITGTTKILRPSVLVSSPRDVSETMHDALVTENLDLVKDIGLGNLEFKKTPRTDIARNARCPVCALQPKTVEVVTDNAALILRALGVTSSDDRAKATAVKFVLNSVCGEQRTDKKKRNVKDEKDAVDGMQ